MPRPSLPAFRRPRSIVTTSTAGMIALLTIVACAHGPSVSPAVRRAAGDEVTTAALREAIDRAFREARRGVDLEIICVRVQTGDPTTVVLTALAESIPLAIAPSSACRIERSGSALFDRAQVVDGDSGKRGMEIYAESLVFTSATAFTVHIGYFQHTEVSGRWMCAGRQAPMGWRVDRCDEE